MNPQCGLLQSDFPQILMFSTQLLIYSIQFSSYCIQSCSGQHQSFDNIFVRKQILNHTEKIQSNLSLKVRMLPYPMGFPRLLAHTFPPAVTIFITMPWPILGSVFQACPAYTEFLRNFNIQRASERSQFQQKRGMISAVPQEGNIHLPKRYEMLLNISTNNCML